jgi:hypothetical protein
MEPETVLVYRMDGTENALVLETSSSGLAILHRGHHRGRSLLDLSIGRNELKAA